MTDAEALAKLEALRKRPRTDLKDGLVQAVMVQAGGFEDKIRRIEMIDLMPDEAPAPEVSRRPKGAIVRPAKAESPPPVSPPPVPSPPPAVDPELTETKRVEHMRRRLVSVPVRGGFWAYLTREFGALVRYGARTSTLTRGFFPFTLKLSPEAQAFLTRTVKTQVLPVLLQTLPTVSKKSWLHLSRGEYNLLAALHELVRVVAEVPVSEGDPTGGGQAWDAVLPHLRLFRTSPVLIAKTLDAWELATAKLGVADKARLAGADAIRTLLEERTDSLSLPDVLLAQLMLRARRQLSWDEPAPEPGEYFARDTFDCGADVQAEIERAAGLLETQLDALVRERLEIRRIRFFLPPYDLLREFDGGAEREDKVAWCLAFLPLLDRAFSPLLEGEVVFADNTQTRLFQNPSLSSSLARLRLLESQMADTAAAADPELVASAGKVVMNLGKTLVVLIRNRSLTADPLARASSTEQLNDPLPHEEVILDRPMEWAGLSVIDALVKAAQVGLQAGRFLGETSLETSLEKESSLPNRGEEILVRLARLVPPAKLEGLRTRWNHDA